MGNGYKKGIRKTNALSNEDRGHLRSYEKTIRVLSDMVKTIVMAYSTGLLVYGPGGQSKTHTIDEELSHLKADAYWFNSHMTARGLFDTLKMAPNAICVLDDLETILRNPQAVGVLRSALWGKRPKNGRGLPERIVTWSTGNDKERIVFTGGIIMIGNRPPTKLPELSAVLTRIDGIELQFSDQQMAAKMRSLCSKRYRFNGSAMTATECRRVIDFLIEESLSLNRPLDMRLREKSFHDYMLSRDGKIKTDWKDLVRTRLRQRPTCAEEVAGAGSRAGQLEQQLQILKDVLATTEDLSEQIRLFNERAGKKGKTTFYRRLKKLKGE